MSAPRHLVRTHELTAADALDLRHPFNPASATRMFMLGDRAGLTRIGISLARVAPGKESFAPHAHRGTEEFVYILAGRGHALIGDAEHEIGPGDFLGFPTDGTPHHLRNTGAEDLIFLQGGERGALDVVEFPTLGKTSVSVGQNPVRFHASATEEALPLTAWLADPAAGE